MMHIGKATSLAQAVLLPFPSLVREEIYQSAIEASLSAVALNEMLTAAEVCVWELTSCDMFNLPAPCFVGQ